MSEYGPVMKKTAPINVSKEVVKHLSIGLYRNFALAIKELISNSYDAGATVTKLKLDLDNNRIVLRDNGRGMSEEEFKNKYLTIGFYKEPSKLPDELGRLRIGAFGIGFLAPLPYCGTLTIVTKKRGSRFALEGTIEAHRFFSGGNWNLKDATVEYNTFESDLPLDEGETIIVLENIVEHIHGELSRETVKRKTIASSGYDTFKWTLQQYCPIEYPPDRNDIRTYFDAPDSVPMELWLDGEQLFRNVPDGTKVLEKGTKDFGDLSVKYVIMTPYEPVSPEEMRGLQVRVRNVAVGFPRDFDVTKLGRVHARLNMLCGEVHVLDGLDNSLLINRDSFSYTQDVANMDEFFRSRLTHWAARLDKSAKSDKELYLALGNVRKDTRIVDDLKDAGLVNFSEKRLRLSEGMLRKTSGKTIGDSVEQVFGAISEKTRGKQQVVREKGPVSEESPAITYEEETKTITIFEEHPIFEETFELDGISYKVQYEKWDYLSTPYSICRLAENNSVVVFNKTHPLFQGKLNDKIVKRLGLGILTTLEGVEDREYLIEKLNNLVKDAFGG